MKRLLLSAIILWGCSGRNSEKHTSADSVQSNSNKIQKSPATDTSLIMTARILNGDEEYNNYSIMKFSNDSISFILDNRFVASIRFTDSLVDNFRERTYVIKGEKNMIQKEIRFSIKKNKTLLKETKYFLNGKITGNLKSFIEFNTDQLEYLFDSLKYFELFDLSYYHPFVMRDYPDEDIISYFMAVDGLSDLNLKKNLEINKEIDSFWKYENDVSYNFDHAQITNLTYANNKLTGVTKYGNIQNPATGIYYSSQDTFFIARRKEGAGPGVVAIWKVEDRVGRGIRHHFFSHTNISDSVVEYNHGAGTFDKRINGNVAVTTKTIKSDLENRELTITNKDNKKIIYHHEIVFVR